MLIIYNMGDGKMENKPVITAEEVKPAVIAVPGAVYRGLFLGRVSKRDDRVYINIRDNSILLTTEQFEKLVNEDVETINDIASIIRDHMKIADTIIIQVSYYKAIVIPQYPKHSLEAAYEDDSVKVQEEPSR